MPMDGTIMRNVEIACGQKFRCAQGGHFELEGFESLRVF
jgi:hypothetical protein